MVYTGLYVTRRLQENRNKRTGGLQEDHKGVRLSDEKEHVWISIVEKCLDQLKIPFL